MSPLLAIIMSLLILVMVNLAHVAGHLIAARLLGVAVNQVSLGIGRALWTRQRGATTLKLALLPVGLFVRLRAPWPRDAAEPPPPAPGGFRGKSLGARLVIVLAAPGALLLLGYCAAIWMASFGTTEVSDRPVVGELIPGAPAAGAGLLPGDRVLAVDGRPTETWRELAELIGSSSDGPVTLELQRGERQLRVEVVPETAPYEHRRLIGIRPALEEVPPPGLLGRLAEAVRIIVHWVGAVAEGLAPLVVGRDEPIEVEGPVAIVAATADGASAQRLRLATTITHAFLGYLLTCLLFPFLDGRRLLNLGIEAVRGRPPHPRTERWLNWILLTLVIVLILISTLSDLSGFLRA